MKKLLLLLLAPFVLFAKPTIAVSYPYIEALVKSVAGDSVEVATLAKGEWDPHFVTPKPSLITTLRKCDALIINGAELEIGFLPPLLNRSANKKLNSSTLDLSTKVDLIDKPELLDRIVGDVHKDGNPHFHLDPHNIPILAKAVMEFLSKLDPQNSATYERNYSEFASFWAGKLSEWDANMASKKGLKVIQFHDVFAYFNNRYGIKSLDNIEPLPGLAPSSKHTMHLLDLIKNEGVEYIVHDVYHSTKTANFLVQKTGIKLVLMPHDIASLKSIDSLVALFDHMVEALK